MSKSYGLILIVLLLALSSMTSYAGSISESVSHTGMLVQGKNINVATVDFNLKTEKSPSSSPSLLTQ